MNNQNANPLGNLISGIQIPPVTIRIEEESLRNLFVWGLVLGTALMLIGVVLSKASK